MIIIMDLICDFSMPNNELLEGAVILEEFCKVIY